MTATITDWPTNLPVSGDSLAKGAEPFTPSAGDLWHGPKVFATMELHAMSEDEYLSTYGD